MSALESFDRSFDGITSAIVFPLLTLFFIVMFFRYYFYASQPRLGSSEWIDMEVDKGELSFFSKWHPMGRSDVAPVLIITALFLPLALFNLGDTVAPQSFFQFDDEFGEIVIELESPVEIGSIMYYPGLWAGHYTLEFSADGQSWHEQTPSGGGAGGDQQFLMWQSFGQAFKWHRAVLDGGSPAVQHIRLTASRVPMELGELALFDADGALVPRSQIWSHFAPELFDEQALVPERPTFMNGMHYYEAYSGGAAFEYLRGLEPSEVSHPPLGKEMIAASIFTLGMTPFGWRFAGAVFGVLMVIALYVLLKNIFGKTSVAACGALLLGFDFMRFVQTRIAMLDSFAVLFILLAYMYMYRHVTSPIRAPFRKNFTPLALSGFFFGLGAATKWSALFAGAGLAAVYLIHLIQLSRLYKTSEWSGFGKYLAKTLLCSFLFFIAVPAAVYCLSYIPHGFANGLSLGGGMLWDAEYYKMIWDSQAAMFSHHATPGAGHMHSSPWWQWLLNLRPVVYYYSESGGLRSSLAAFGNPVVWWGGLAAMGFLGYRVFRYSDGKALFIIIGYLSHLLPWLFVPQVTFIYHYFPGALFLVMALAHVFNTLFERRRGRFRLSVYGYTAAAGAVFALFYPALSGIYAPHWYFNYLLRWIPGAWPF